MIKPYLEDVDQFLVVADQFIVVVDRILVVVDHPWHAVDQPVDPKLTQQPVATVNLRRITIMIMVAIIIINRRLTNDL